MGNHTRNSAWVQNGSKAEQENKHDTMVQASTTIPTRLPESLSAALTLLMLGPVLAGTTHLSLHSSLGSLSPSGWSSSVVDGNRISLHIAFPLRPASLHPLSYAYSLSTPVVRHTMYLTPAWPGLLYPR